MYGHNAIISKLGIGWRCQQEERNGRERNRIMQECLMRSMKSSMVLKLLNLVMVVDDIEDLKKLRMYAVNSLHSIMICFS